MVRKLYIEYNIKIKTKNNKDNYLIVERIMLNLTLERYLKKCSD